MNGRNIQSVPENTALNEMWNRWLVYTGNEFHNLLSSDLNEFSPSLSLQFLTVIETFAEQFRSEGKQWRHKGIRGDQIESIIKPFEAESKNLCDFLYEKIHKAERNKWLGGGVEEITLQAQKNYSKFIIASVARSGTHFLRTLLNSHPNIEMHGEAFNVFGQHLLPYRVDEVDMNTILDKHLFRYYFEYTEAVGFILFRDMDLFWANEDVWGKLKADPDLKIIFLDRNNQLERFVSLTKSLEDKIWYLGRNDSRKIVPKTISVSILELTKFIDEYVENKNKFFDVFENHACLQLTFEDLLQNTTCVSSTVLDFIQASPHRLVSGTVKKQQLPLQLIVENYSEILQELKGTIYERYI